MIALDEARALLLEGAARLGSERLPLADAAGRILAEDVVATRDQPPHAVSAMDGYAVRAADARIDAELRIIGDSPAGAPFAASVGQGEAVRIATGGVVPAGAERIVIQENVVRNGGCIRLTALSDASFVRPAGGDFARGMILARAGDRLTPARLGLAAAAGLGELTVARRPRVAILPSGDELSEPGDDAPPDAIFNSATTALAALVEQWGGIAIRHPILPDERADLDRALAASDLVVDVIVTIGGASVGDRDALRPAFAALGAALRFDRIAVVPGKPTWHARFPDGRLVLGLPGNPASAFVCAHLLLRPLLAALTGAAPALRLSHGQLAAALSANGPREAWLRATAAVDQRGTVQLTVDPRQDSSLMTPLAAANALVRRPIAVAASPAGALVEYLSLSPPA